MNQIKVVFQNFQKCLGVAPLAIASLMLYLSLRSTSILPNGLHVFNGMYHPSYLGWYDFVLGYSIIFSFACGALRLELKDIFLGLILIFIISASWISTYEQDKSFILAGIVCFLRFYLVFVFAKSLVRKLDLPTAESILLFAYSLLAVSAILWYSLQFGVQNRMAASAMTAPSFAQVSAIMCLIFYTRKYYVLLFISFIFLFLTFSRTSLLLFLLLIIIQNRKVIPWNLMKYVVGFVALATVGIMVLKHYGGHGTQVVLESRFSTEEMSNLNGRSEIWTHAWETIKYGKIPLFGIGFHTAPSLIKESNVKYLNGSSGGFYIPPHYHSILVEYSLTLGIFSLVVFFYFINRIWQTFQHNYTPSFFIFAFFLFSQALDYTFYGPKEIIIFSLMLGLAEGQFSCQS